MYIHICTFNTDPIRGKIHMLLSVATPFSIGLCAFGNACYLVHVSAFIVTYAKAKAKSAPVDLEFEYSCLGSVHHNNLAH